MYVGMGAPGNCRLRHQTPRHWGASRAATTAARVRVCVCAGNARANNVTRMLRRRSAVAAVVVALALWAATRKAHRPRIVASTQLSPAAARALERFRDSKAIRDGFYEALVSRWGGPYRGTVHTVLTFLARNPLRSLVVFRRETLVLADGGTVALDRAGSGRGATVLLHHGLAGDSTSFYVRHLADELIARGFSIVSFVARGCGGLELSTSEGFTAARTQDMREVVAKLRSDLGPDAELYAVGFSLGAGILLKYLGEEGAACTIKAAVAISPSFDYLITTPHFDTWSRVRLVHGLKQWANRHRHVLRDTVDYDVLTTVATVREFDAAAIVRQYGYKDVDDYYLASSPRLVAHNIAVPTVALTAGDDPVCSAAGVPAADKLGPGLVSVQSDYGGHVAFGEGVLGTSSWQDRVVLDWIDAVRRGL